MFTRISGFANSIGPISLLRAITDLGRTGVPLQSLDLMAHQGVIVVTPYESKGGHDDDADFGAAWRLRSVGPGHLRLLTTVPADMSGINAAVLFAVESRLRELANDPALSYSFWLFNRIV